MTSNTGSDIILENSLTNTNFEQTKEEVNTLLRSIFKPEFLNRIDETIFFKALNLGELSQIVDIQTGYLRELLHEQELDVEITPDAKELLATRGFNPVYGARPLKRIIRQMVENPLSKLILTHKFSDRIIIDTKDDEIVFNKG
jgi:ATP-dependent Clp protease ATP-binding subunit ClpB